MIVSVNIYLETLQTKANQENQEANLHIFILKLDLINSLYVWMPLYMRACLCACVNVHMSAITC